MNITTKFNIGDEVLVLYYGTIVKAIVVGIAIVVQYDGKITHERYEINHLSGEHFDNDVSVEQVFANKEELIKHINIVTL